LKIGIIVDGDAESQALKLLTRRVEIKDTQLLDPLYANMQPKDAPGQIARAAKRQIDILIAKGADKIIVLIDREDNRKCADEIAGEIETAFDRLGCANTTVVIKNRKFENWLIADVGVFRKLKARYKVTKSFETAVVPNKADSVADAEALLNQIVVKVVYHKRRDAAQITGLQKVAEIGKNSRSFRRFLRVVGYSTYTNQSKNP